VSLPTVKLERFVGRAGHLDDWVSPSPPGLTLPGDKEKDSNVKVTQQKILTTYNAPAANWKKKPFLLKKTRPLTPF